MRELKWESASPKSEAEEEGLVESEIAFELGENLAVEPLVLPLPFTCTTPSPSLERGRKEPLTTSHPFLNNGCTHNNTPK